MPHHTPNGGDSGRPGPRPFSRPSIPSGVPAPVRPVAPRPAAPPFARVGGRPAGTPPIGVVRRDEPTVPTALPHAEPDAAGQDVVVPLISDVAGQGHALPSQPPSALDTTSLGDGVAPEEVGRMDALVDELHATGTDWFSARATEAATGSTEPAENLPMSEERSEASHAASSEPEAWPLELLEAPAVEAIESTNHVESAHHAPPIERAEAAPAPAPALGGWSISPAAGTPGDPGRVGMLPPDGAFTAVPVSARYDFEDAEEDLAEFVASSASHERAAEIMEAVARRVRSGEIVVSIDAGASEAMVVASVLTALLRD
jgi:hypothetical protein